MVAARLSSLFYSAIDQKFFPCQEVHISPSIYAVSSSKTPQYLQGVHYEETHQHLSTDNHVLFYDRHSDGTAG